ncbi:MAG TPA: pseudouridine synthase [Candidatus Saccharimonadales bacterium]|nr:pseudouridine synthase [Candidatus Saccharimonadales bacterium]
MRINKFLALATGMSRRTADAELARGSVQVNGTLATLGQQVTTADTITYNGRPLDTKALQTDAAYTTIMLNKPVGYVVSRNGQGSRTIYDLLPTQYHGLKPIGRLDKDSSGLLLLTDNGQLAHELTHPSRQKQKVYEIALDNPLQPLHRQMISDHGVQLEDGVSRFEIERLRDGDDKQWRVIMHEGRNRQIRRTFAALGYTVVKLHRTHFGPYILNAPPGIYTQVY